MKDEPGKFTGSEGLDEKTSSSEMALLSFSGQPFSIEKEVAAIEKDIKFYNLVKIVALKLTKASDWINQGGSPYLMDRGAENIAIAFGVDISDVRLAMEWADDDKGRYYSFVASGKAYAKKLGRYIEDIGVCSQRDKFFGMFDGKFKEIAEVDMANIRRKAVTNLYSRLIKRVIGLMGVTFEDLAAAGIKKEDLQRVEYQKGGEKAKAELSDEGKDLRQKLESMLLKMANGDKAEATKLLEKYTHWTDKDKKEHFATDLAKMSEKWIALTYKKVKSDYDKIANGPAQEREAGQEG